METEKKTLGILGGMGPEATIDFMKKLLKLTPANKDQDHIRTIVINDPKVPDRTEAILHGGQSPLPKIKRNLKILEDSRVDLLVIPCNTAHHWLKEIRNTVDVPVLSLMEETAKYLKDVEVSTMGLLSTTATAKIGLYHDKLDFIELLTPNDQKEVMNAIKNVKAGEKGKAIETMLNAAKNLLQRGAEAIIAGCTEVPLVLSSEDVPLVDPVLLLARSSVKIIKGEAPTLPFSPFS